jgi:hypothetical protein
MYTHTRLKLGRPQSSVQQGLLKTSAEAIFCRMLYGSLSNIQADFGGFSIKIKIKK